jgi:Tol biopolymer transport system component
MRLTFFLAFIFFSNLGVEAHANNDHLYEIIAVDGTSEAHAQLIQINTGHTEELFPYKGHAPNWSPDGTKIASINYTTGIDSISILNIQSMTSTEWGVAYPETVSVYSITWSPDSSEIAMLRCWRGEPYGCNLDLLDFEQGIIRRLASNFPQSTLVTLSPNARQIFYSPEKPSFRYSKLYVFDIETGKTHLIIDVSGNIKHIKWSPDSTKIAFEYCQETACAIFSVNSDGTNQQKLVNYRGANAYYSWSPDSRSIIFSSGEYGYEQAFIVELDTAHWKSLIVDGLSVQSPEFSPDGKKIAFLSCGQKITCTLYIVDYDGTNLQRLVDLRNVEYTPTFAWRTQLVPELP